MCVLFSFHMGEGEGLTLRLKEAKVLVVLVDLAQVAAHGRQTVVSCTEVRVQPSRRLETKEVG